MGYLIVCALALVTPLAPAAAAPGQAAYLELLAADQTFADAAKDRDLVAALTAMFDVSVI